MLEKVSKKARGTTNVFVFLMDAECLGFPGNNFEYVVTTFILCSIPDPLKVLKE
jgi:ubiquinone/menaquinone biosynthesis C-methylase UbiE